VCLRIPRRHAPVKALQRPLDDPLDCPVRPTHTSIDRNGHRECHFPHSCTSSGGRVGAGFWTALSKDDHPPSRHDTRASARPTRRMLSVGGTASSGVARNGGGSTYGRSAEDEHQPHATLRSDVGQRSPPSTTDIPAWLVALRLHVEHLERLHIERRRARLRHDHPLAVRLVIPSGHAPPSSLCVAVCSAAAAAGECRGQSTSSPAATCTSCISTIIVPGRHMARHACPCVLYASRPFNGSWDTASNARISGAIV